MICINHFVAKIAVSGPLSVDVIAVHTGVDQQVADKTPLDDLVGMRFFI